MVNNDVGVKIGNYFFNIYVMFIYWMGIFFLGDVFFVLLIIWLFLVEEGFRCGRKMRDSRILFWESSDFDEKFVVSICIILVYVKIECLLNFYFRVVVYIGIVRLIGFLNWFVNCVSFFCVDKCYYLFLSREISFFICFLKRVVCVVWDF